MKTRIISLVVVIGLTMSLLACASFNTKCHNFIDRDDYEDWAMLWQRKRNWDGPKRAEFRSQARKILADWLSRMDSAEHNLDLTGAELVARQLPKIDTLIHDLDNDFDNHISNFPEFSRLSNQCRLAHYLPIIVKSRKNLANKEYLAAILNSQTCPNDLPEGQENRKMILTGVLKELALTMIQQQAAGEHAKLAQTVFLIISIGHEAKIDLSAYSVSEFVANETLSYAAFVEKTCSNVIEKLKAEARNLFKENRFLDSKACLENVIKLTQIAERSEYTTQLQLVIDTGRNYYLNRASRALQSKYFKEAKDCYQLAKLIDPNIDVQSEIEKVDVAEQIERGRVHLENGDQAVREGRLPEALREYDDTQKYLGKSAALTEKIIATRDKIGIKKMLQAEESFKAKDYKAAIYLADEAEKYLRNPKEAQAFKLKVREEATRLILVAPAVNHTTMEVGTTSSRWAGLVREELVDRLGEFFKLADSRSANYDYELRTELSGYDFQYSKDRTGANYTACTYTSRRVMARCGPFGVLQCVDLYTYSPTSVLQYNDRAEARIYIRFSLVDVRNNICVKEMSKEIFKTWSQEYLRSSIPYQYLRYAPSCGAWYDTRESTDFLPSYLFTMERRQPTGAEILEESLRYQLITWTKEMANVLNNI